MFKFVENGHVSGLDSVVEKISWGGKDFNPSKRVCVLSKTFIEEIENIATRYFTIIRGKLSGTNASEDGRKNLLSSIGCPESQIGYWDFQDIPRLVRIDMSIDGNGEGGIFELQPRPGGMGIFSCVWECLKDEEALLMPLFRQSVLEACGISMNGNGNGNRREKKAKKVAFLVCESGKYEKNPPYLPEFRFFAEKLEDENLKIEIIFEEDVKEEDLGNYDAVYPRGTWYRDIPDAVKLFQEKKIPFIVPPGYLFHSKAWLAHSMSRYVPRTELIGNLDEMKVEWLSSLPKKERDNWIVKPAVDYAAKDVNRGRSYTQKKWGKFIAENPNFVIQQAFLSQADFPELDGKAHWIIRPYLVYCKGRYNFAGGMWIARKNTIRIHGAEDAVSGLLDVE